MKTLYTLMPLALLLLAAPVASYAQAQNDGYDYATFRFPDIDRRALMLDINLNGAGTAAEDRWVTLRQTARDHQFWENMSLSYERFRNLPKVQAFESYSLGNSLFTSTERSDALNVDRGSLSSQLSTNVFSFYRYYYRPERFLGFELSASAGHNVFRQHDRLAAQRLRSRAFSADVLPAFQHGWGRVEPIDDVFLAKFMADDLLENGVLSENLSQEQLFALGQRMAFVRNQRIFDARRLRIFELTEIDRWFKEEGLAGDGDILYFTTLTDNWLYAFRNTRFAGSRFTVGLQPGFAYRHFKNDQSTSEVQAASLGLNAQYTRHRPLNQYWQASTTAETGIEYTQQLSPAEETDWRPYLSVAQRYGFFPNSRTRISGMAIASYFYLLDLAGEPSRNDVHSVSASLNLSADYFVNYQFVIRATFQTGYLWGRTQITALPSSSYLTENQFNYRAGLQFVYTFF